METEKQCGEYLKHISDVLQRDCNNALQATGLTMSQLSVLYQLENAPGGELPMKELEKALMVAQPTAAGIISRLEQKNLVAGSGSESDKRVKIVRITETGRACFKEAQAFARESEAHLLAALSEAEQAQFYLLLEKISKSLSCSG